MQSPHCAGISIKNYSKSEEFRCVWEKTKTLSKWKNVAKKLNSPMLAQSLTRNWQIIGHKKPL